MNYNTRKLFLIITLPIALGIFTGAYFGGQDLFKKVVYKDVSGKSLVLAKGQEVGSNDKKSTRDSAIGLLVNSDDLIKGTYMLVRGSDALTVYLTSSTIDLSQFVGLGIQIWGETFQRENVGWFMDVIRLKVIKL